MLTDRLFWAALVAALVFWGVLAAVTQQAPVWGWPLDSPGRYLLLALVYPVVEEIVFRGFVQEGLQQRFTHKQLGPFSWANIITSLLFTALHFIYHPPLWSALVFVPSLMFGFFKDKYQRLLPCMVLHAFYNAGYYWLFTH